MLGACGGSSMDGMTLRAPWARAPDRRANDESTTNAPNEMGTSSIAWAPPLLATGDEEADMQCRQLPALRFPRRGRAGPAQAPQLPIAAYQRPPRAESSFSERAPILPPLATPTQLATALLALRGLSPVD
eukprot:CAMPEP_0169426448 /NCGR_PEP_ID=MMETSP1042-20121227/208_1 /TAXON_ID=464988 /ORGANISM="Hemiselmis andersenii, Strain CCMP1180" /LENGTH=129 /DNA_ID=CAMNT_0009536371 /DNA_START=635 /DNA_END=1024 /DNA_ORIENTATION=-